MTPTILLADHPHIDTHTEGVGEDRCPRGDQDAFDIQDVVVASGSNLPTDHGRLDAHSSSVGAVPSPQGDQTSNDTQLPLVTLGPFLADPFLALAADVLDDLERVRIANENRLRQLTRDVPDSDGEVRGFGLSTEHPDVKRLAVMVTALAKVEHDATLNLQRMMRKHPLGPWIKATKGIGEKQGARLLASIGDPYWNDLHDRPRTVSELWAYCGYHTLATGQNGSDTHSRAAGGNLTSSNPDQGGVSTQGVVVRIAATKARGQIANWSDDAKMRTNLISVSIVKNGAGGPYREVYDQGRAKYADALHGVVCRRCGPAGKPAQVGSPLSDGHKHARALRLVSKEVLKGLWREAKRLHEEL